MRGQGFQGLVLVHLLGITPADAGTSIKDFEFRRAVINALVNSVFVYDDDTDPNKKGRIRITPADAGTSSLL